MKVYIAEYNSEVNSFKGFVVLKAETLQQAQDKFIEWLKLQNVYQHMWQLNFRIIGDNHKAFTVYE